MPVKEITVTRWETSDGAVFENKEGARLHERTLSPPTFIDWYETHFLLACTVPSDYGTLMDAHKLFYWLKKHLPALRDMEIFKDDK